MSDSYFIAENDFWVTMDALEPICDKHMICMPKNGHRGFLQCGTVLYQEGLEMLQSVIDKMLEAGHEYVFVYEELNPTSKPQPRQTSTERYLNILPIESDFYGAFRYLQQGWQSEASFASARRNFSEGGYQLAAIFSNKGHEIVIRPLRYSLPPHYLRKMSYLFFNRTLSEKNAPSDKRAHLISQSV